MIIKSYLFIVALECLEQPHPMLLSYLGGPWLVGRAALQVCQDAGEGVDLGIQTGASLLQRLLRSFHLSANMAKGAKQ